MKQLTVGVWCNTTVNETDDGVQHNTTKKKQITVGFWCKLVNKTVDCWCHVWSNTAINEQMMVFGVIMQNQ